MSISHLFITHYLNISPWFLVLLEHLKFPLLNLEEIFFSTVLIVIFLTYSSYASVIPVAKVQKKSFQPYLRSRVRRGPSNECQRQTYIGFIICPTISKYLECSCRRNFWLIFRIEFSCQDMIRSVSVYIAVSHLYVDQDFYGVSCEVPFGVFVWTICMP